MNELQGLKLDPKGFILAHERVKSFIKSRIKNHISINFEIKGHGAFNSHKKDEDESVKRVLPIVENERLQRKIILHCTTIAKIEAVSKPKILL